jgi:hypothetical protein
LKRNFHPRRDKGDVRKFKEDAMATFKLVRFFGQDRRGLSDEHWCLDGKVHVYIEIIHYPFGGGSVPTKTRILGPCDGKECLQYHTTNGVEHRYSPLHPSSVLQMTKEKLENTIFSRYIDLLVKE